MIEWNVSVNKIVQAVRFWSTNWFLKNLISLDKLESDGQWSIVSEKAISAIVFCNWTGSKFLSYLTTRLCIFV